MRKKFESGSKFITKKKKKIDIGKIAANAMKKKSPQYIIKKQSGTKPTSKFITRKDKKESPQYITKKQKPFITKKSPQEIREREMIRSKKMGGGMMGRRFGMKKGSKFPDLTGDGKVTFADILKGRGVINGKKKKKA